ncbi:nitronate monooxygenase [Streptomyces sp. RB6PN25]|uniref:Nitronate monooxygenase n=1 Tax=Streptomyces humicola TaxID=2953240 RepID=A0ABT1PSQ5_9ACTN|nr:nitronate monooxygenase [Streptomyces humicola]MCQ4080681.1 nitronate monooxygenase [Streptomyces humicola]
MRTRLTELVGVEHPIVQTAMGYVAYPRLVAATARAGALGILASATMTYEELERAIGEVRAAAPGLPFGVNLRADAPDAARRIDLMGREDVRVASFAQAPRGELIRRAQDLGMVVVPSIGARRHAEKVAAWGVDAVVVQGGEGGGHTGAVPTTLLLPQVVDALDGSGVAVVAAGGFFDGRGLAAALAYGADGIAMGTRFLLTSDAPVPRVVQDRYLAADVTGTRVTREVDGVPHRVLDTGFVRSLERGGQLRRYVRALGNALRFARLSGMPLGAMVREGRTMRRARGLTWPQVMMAANTPVLLRAAMVEGRVDLGVMASGQVAGVIEDLPSCVELVERIVAQAEERMAPWGRAAAGRAEEPAADPSYPQQGYPQGGRVS